VTKEQFAVHMQRLVDTFGDRAYPPERMKLIYQEVADFGDTWWKLEVDKLIGNHRIAPLLSEIREAAAREREGRAYREKMKHRVESENAYKRLSREELSTIFRGLKKRISGEMPDQEFENFTRLLNTMESGNDD
jgi:hypothetical protein